MPGQACNYTPIIASINELIIWNMTLLVIAAISIKFKSAFLHA